MANIWIVNCKDAVSNAKVNIIVSCDNYCKYILNICKTCRLQTQ